MRAAGAAELSCHRAPGLLGAAASLAAEAGERLPTVALVGRPNVGKSTFFAHATGRYAESANVPGTTVGISARRVSTGHGEALLVDLPGVLTLADRSDGLSAFWELLAEIRPDALLVVADAGNLGRHLPLVLACRDLGLPLVVAANLVDEAQGRGIDIDAGRLSQLLVAPVHRTVGRRGTGVAAAVRDAVELAVAGRDFARPVPPYAAEVVRRVGTLARRLRDSDPVEAVPGPLAAAVADRRLSAAGAATLALGGHLEPERWRVAERWAAQVERRRDVRVPFADRLGRIVTAPWPGLPLFGAVTVASLVVTMAVGTLLSSVLAAAWAGSVSPVLTRVVGAVLPVPSLAAATLWALDSGLLAMLAVGIPFVLTFYLVLALLEDSGYLAAAAVLSDRLFNAFGLPGRAAIPVLAATGCNVPALYGTRVLESRRERLLASFLIVLTPCSARSAVVVAALTPFAGPAVALAAFAVVALIAVGSGVAANALVPGTQSPLVLELPPIRMPIASQVARKAWFRFRSFVRTATPVMLAGSFLLGLAYETGALLRLQEIIGPAVGWLLGLPAVAGIALVLAFLRKELALQVLIVLAVAEFGAAATALDSFLTPAQLFVYAVATAVSLPCAATLAALADELGRRAAIGIAGACFAIGLGAAAIVARLLGAA